MEEHRDRPLLLFCRSLRAAFRRSPAWLFCWAVPALTALAVALPWKVWFESALGGHYAPYEVLASMDETFRFDHREELGALRASTATAAAGLGIGAILFGAFCAGGWLQLFLERKHGKTLRRFLWGGVRYFWRFVRLALLTLLVLSLFGWVLYGWPWKVCMGLLFGAKDGNLEVLASERTAVWIGWLQAGGYAVLFALTLAWGDYTRTRMALHDTRSAVWAGLCTLGFLVLNPLQALRPFALLFFLEVAVVQGLGAASWSLNTGLGPDSSWKALVGLLLLGQLAMLYQVISRGARYHAAAAVSRSRIPPLAQPDPWASRVGGPGGPQYPIDETDDYGVSI